jgi:hypothetical protein
MANSPTSGPGDALPRQPIDPAAYERRSREGPCFVCQTLAGHPDYPGHFVWTDDHAVAFLASYNTLLGHTLVAPEPIGSRPPATSRSRSTLPCNVWCIEWEKRSGKSCPPSGSTS